MLTRQHSNATTLSGPEYLKPDDAATMLTGQHVYTNMSMCCSCVGECWCVIIAYTTNTLWAAGMAGLQDKITDTCMVSVMLSKSSFLLHIICTFVSMQVPAAILWCPFPTEHTSWSSSYNSWFMQLCKCRIWTCAWPRCIQWNLSIADTIVTQLAVLYREVSLIQR